MAHVAYTAPVANSYLAQNIGRFCAESGDLHTLVRGSGKVHYYLLSVSTPWEGKWHCSYPRGCGSSLERIRLQMWTWVFKKNFIYDAQNAVGFLCFTHCSFAGTYIQSIKVHNLFLILQI